MVVLLYDIAAFAKMKEKSNKKSEGQIAKYINMKKPLHQRQKSNKSITQTRGAVNMLHRD